MQVKDLYPTLYVEDLTRSLAFYRDGLGLEESYRWPPDGEPEYVEVVQEDRTLGLFERDAAARETGLEIADGGPLGELVLFVEDIGDATRQLTAMGYPALREPSDKPWGVRAAYFSDPDGHLLYLAQKLG